MDADNIAVRDVTEVFESDEYVLRVYILGFIVHDYISVNTKKL